MKNHQALRSFALRALPMALAMAGMASVQAATLPKNLGSGLAELVGQQAAGSVRDARSKQLGKAEASQMATVSNDTTMMRDAGNRVLVDITLNRSRSYDQVRALIAGVPGMRITAEDRSYRSGIVEGYVPESSLATLAKLRGVLAVHAVIRPTTNVGLTTQQGVVQHRVDQVSQDGTGITVGVMSDSYNTSTSTIKAADDVASGDLPGAGNPLGNTQPVVVLDEAPALTDEGRAMLQLVHDMAPKARLGFASAFNGNVSFANNIRALAGVQGLPTSSPDFAAQVIVDDVQYFDEGMFSDTVIAQAVDDVTAMGVSYFSSAGNTPPTQGYASDFRLVPTGPNATAGTNINLAGVDPALYAGGFHNFRTDGGQDIGQTVTLASGRKLEIVMQWDDPYDVAPTSVGAVISQQTGALTSPTAQADFPLTAVAGRQYVVDVHGTSTVVPGADLDVIVTVLNPDGSTLQQIDTGAGENFGFFAPTSGNYTLRVTGYNGDQGTFTITVNQGTGTSSMTTDFNLLFFRTDTGAFVGSVAENNLASNRPIELSGTITFPAGVNQVQLVISRANTPTAPVPASRLRYKTRNGAYPVEYYSYNTPVTYGHNSAAGANGVAAYSPFQPSQPEDFSSTGPVRIVWDRNNNRVPEDQQVRLKPEMAAMDGGNTTFFGGDTNRDLDPFPNFFGTSAAAPTAASIAALVLQARGGPGSVTPAQMRTILQRSAFPHDLDPYRAVGQAVTSNRGKVTVVMEGDNSLTAQLDANGTSVSYVGTSSITSITFNAQTGNPGGGNVVDMNTPGLVFDTRAPNSGQPFVVGAGSVGLGASDVSATYFNAAPAPSVAGMFYGVTLNFTPGAFVGGKALRFGLDRDEFRSAFAPPTGDSRNGSGADLAGANVRIPSGQVAAGGISFTGTLADGSTFSGVMKNRIGAGWSFLDGYGFINAERAVSLPLP
ncbi:MAG: S8 family serine peptidase [Pseudomonadota bacterium]|nr:S8 family serine peptidase [Pseudomonadota bacterium]